MSLIAERLHFEQTREPNGEFGPGDGTKSKDEGSPYDQLVAGNQAWRDGLSKDQVQTLSDYQYGYFSGVNDMLRQGQDPEVNREGRQEAIGHLDSAIAAGHLTEDTGLFRGVSSGVLPSDPKEAEAMVGRSFTDNGYTSMSLDPQVAMSFARGEITSQQGEPVLIHMLGEKGQAGATMDLIEKGTGQQEFLLPRGLTYDIVNVNRVRDRETGKGMTKYIVKAR